MGGEVAGAKLRYNQQVRVTTGEYAGEIGWIVAIQPSAGAEPLYTVELIDGDPNAEVPESSLEPAAIIPHRNGPAGNTLALFLAQQFAVRIAALIKSTEAAAFGVQHAKDEEKRLVPLFHIRPGPCTPAERAAAMDAFAQMVLECVKRGRGGPLRVKEDQWCLTTLFLDEGVIVGAAAFITRSADEAVVSERMAILSGMNV
jgi:hypothetical protein